MNIDDIRFCDEDHKYTKEIDIPLAKALALKNRLIADLTQAGLDLPCASSPDFNPLPAELSADIMLTRYFVLMDCLIKLKSAISKANSDSHISEKIFELAELKTAMTHIKRFIVEKNVARDGYGDTVKLVSYIPSISRTDKAELMRKLQARMDELQDSMSYANATVRITTPVPKEY